MPLPVRLNKFISNSGICSRRKADEMISAGRVSINGKIITDLGVKIDPVNDKVFFNEKQVVNLDKLVYILFNKPKDCITTAKDERGRSTVMDYVSVRERIYPIGRLDRNTTGALLLTNDGEFANMLMHPRHEVKKAYRVGLDKPLTPEAAAKLEKGIRLSDGKTEPAEIVPIRKGKQIEVGIVIHEGRNRQVHRMFEALDYEVKKLERVAYGGITTEGLGRGRWRYLTSQEVRALKKVADEGEREKSD
jgi:23S rRNA pseudouridine2605 synthase